MQAKQAMEKKPVLKLELKDPRFQITNLRDVRESCGFSLTLIADLAGISKSYLHDIESGRRLAPAATADSIGMAIEAAWEARKCQTKKSHAKK